MVLAKGMCPRSVSTTVMVMLNQRGILRGAERRDVLTKSIVSGGLQIIAFRV
jgi:hypothetical protein